jgi:hypothetical protein
MPRRALIGKRFERAGKSAVLEPEPCSAGTHVELIVERVRLAETQRFLFAMKSLVHYQSNSRVAILW